MAKTMPNFSVKNGSSSPSPIPQNLAPVILRGLHIAFHTETEERLMVQIEGLSPGQFRDLAVALEDWMEVVDENYKVKATRGRGWKGRGKRLSEKQRIRVVRFSPFPSSFSNVLRTIRRNLYIELHRYCLVLEGQKHGGYRHNIYILPYANAPPLMNFMETQNAIIDDLNEKIAEFQQTGHFTDIGDVLKEYNYAHVLGNGKRWKIGHITFDATPLALEPSTVREMVEDEYKQMYQKLDEDERRGIEALHAELERKRREIVLQAIENLRKKLDVVVRKIVAAGKKKPERAKEDLEHLHKLATSVGLEALATHVIEPLSFALENPEKTVEIFGTRELSTAVDSRIRGLIESL